jgi:hypothetical protein
VEETGIPAENHRPVTSNWRTLSHNVVSVHLSMSGIRTRPRWRTDNAIVKRKRTNNDLLQNTTQKTEDWTISNFLKCLFESVSLKRDYWQERICLKRQKRNLVGIRIHSGRSLWSYMWKQTTNTTHPWLFYGHTKRHCHSDKKKPYRHWTNHKDTATVCMWKEPGSVQNKCYDIYQ